MKKFKVFTKTTVIITLLWMYFPLQATAFTVYGSGTASCGTWVEERKRNNHQDMEAWVQGYLSAAGNYETNQLNKVDRQAFLVWLDNYCQNNPLKKVIDGAQALVHEIEKK
jgi:hypothetical protein